MSYGSIAVEFAFICPILMTLCLGICEFGMAFYNSAQQAVWDVTRQLSTGTIAPADAQARIRDRLPSWAKDGADVPAPVLDASGSYKITFSTRRRSRTKISDQGALMGSATETMEQALCRGIDKVANA